MKNRKQYDPQKLLEAVSEVRNGKITTNAASKKFGVPRKSIADHVHGRVAEQKLPGVNGMLTEEEENALVHYIEYMSGRNMPLRRSDIRGTVVVSLTVYF